MYTEVGVGPIANEQNPDTWNPDDKGTGTPWGPEGTIKTTENKQELPETG